ncbi:MAG: right-handed parallel beta-helix repeat-containing protein [Ignavibacteriae bacterium]|nr:right-handed parallel beta-helix repeat-containing protein [Ignavibacteriota bacterium]
MMRFLMMVMAALLASTQVDARILYVSTSGLDTNPGTFELPFRNISKGYSTAVAGDTIMLRGGTFALTATISFSKSGSTANKYYLLAYPGEYVLIDFSGMGGSSRGFSLSGSYWYIRGLDFYKAPDNGMHISGSNNTVERCIFRENGDTGLQLSNGASNNRIINSDSYYNVDASQGNADGFAPKLDVGTGNYFYGCRAWQNSDDGWDGYIRPRPAVVPTTTMENCWTFRNGYLKSGAASTGNGNGFKMGGSDTANLSHNVILKNCLAFQNRVKGFDQNNDRGSMTLLNCTAFSNGTNYGMSGVFDAGSVMTLKNCVSAGTGGVNVHANAVQATNSWRAPFVVTNDDFQSIDTTGVRGPRNADGSLPTLSFMRLAPGSDLIDAGTNVGLPFNGSAPDLGCFETSGPSSAGDDAAVPGIFHLDQNYPNPFNPETQITFSVAPSGRATLVVYNLLGQKVATLFEDDAERGRVYTVKFSGARLSGGAYIYRLQSGANVAARKFILLK